MSIKLNKFLLTTLIFTVIIGSGCNHNAGNHAGNSSDDSFHLSQGEETVLIPDSIAEPQERADYLVLHFWDNHNFPSVLMPEDSIEIEQNFSDFISILPLANGNARHDGVDILLDKAHSSSHNVYSYLTDLAEKYLWDAESPFYSEELFLPFIEYYIRKDNKMKERALFLRKEIFKNAPGSLAPDFKFERPDGKTAKLSDVISKTPVILMFYQPDCETCHNSISVLRSSQNLNDAIKNGDIGLLAVYIGDRREEWGKHASTLPGNWTVGIDENEMIDKNDLYSIKATPSFYVINKDGRIILKDAPMSSLLDFIESF